jgi:hypothetical protein
MKHKIASAILLMNVFMLFSGVILFAQAQHIRVTVPFPFTVKRMNFPAGTYTIRKSDETSEDTYTIRSVNGRLFETFLTEASQQKSTPTKTELVFDHVGAKYFLAKFFDAGEDSGRQLMKTDSELSQEAMMKVQTQRIIAAQSARND